MKNSRTYIHTTLLTLALTMLAAIYLISCSEKKEEIPDTALPRLEAIEAIIESHPDSAASALSAISPDTLPSPASRALYYLLSTTIDIYTYNLQESDSLINESVIYYQNSKDSERLAKALLYNGRRLYFNKKDSEAMINAIEGLNTAERINAPKLSGKLHDLIADIDLNLKDIPGELEHRKKAIEYYNKAQSPLYYDYALLSYANSLLNNKEYNNLCKFIEQSSFASFPPIPEISTEFNDLYALGKYYGGNYDEGIKLLRENICYNHGSGSALSYIILSNDELKRNNPESALYWLDRTKSEFPESKISYYSGMNAYYLYIKDFRRASLMSDSILLTQNTQLEEMLANQLSEALSQYYKEKHSLMESIHKRDKAVMMITYLFLTILGGCIFYIYRQRTKRIRLQMDNLMAETHNALELVESERESKKILLEKIHQNETNLKNAQSEIEQKKGELNNVAELANSLFRQKFHVLNKLCVDYFEHEEEDSARIAIYNQLKKEIKAISNSQFLNNLEHEINATTNLLIKSLREDFPSFKESDYIFILLQLAGFKARTVCLILNISLTNFYAKRKRLKDRISQFQGVRKQEYIDIFSKD